MPDIGATEVQTRSPCQVPDGAGRRTFGDLTSILTFLIVPVVVV